MPANNTRTRLGSNRPRGINPSESYSSTWLNLFRLTLKGNDRLTFICLCTVIAFLGLITNVCIISANVLYRLRFNRDNIFFGGCTRTMSGLMRTSMISVNSFKTSATPDLRNSYFQALSGQARFRYSHVIFAVAVFSFVSCLVFIPLAALNVTASIPNVEVDNMVVFICVAWSVFQVLLLAFFFFINTTIQFLSVIFPLTFKLRRSPLFGAFFVIVILSGIHTALTLDVIVKDLCQIIFVLSAGRKHKELEESLAKMQIVLAIPLGVFVLTWILTIAMYAAVLKQIHSASASLSRLQVSSEKPQEQLRGKFLFQSRRWHSSIKKNLHKSLILGAGTFAYYLLETPSFFVIYKIVKPNYWALLAHISVHAVTPILHISLSKSFRRAFTGVLGTQRPSFFFQMPPLESTSGLDDDLQEGSTMTLANG